MELIEDECPWFKKAVERHASSGSAAILPQNATFRVILQSKLLTRRHRTLGQRIINPTPDSREILYISSRGHPHGKVGGGIDSVPCLYQKVQKLLTYYNINHTCHPRHNKPKTFHVGSYCNSGVSNTFCGILNSDPCSSNALQICTE
ncbi:hypothetical protein Fot_50541 [Forsythia ovata]|uniref:Uncharacterized protein n=1 Tax=Forsythia ovata TaxID=205694 RepID=A0ABD1PYF2_9LAMI